MTEEPGQSGLAADGIAIDDPMMLLTADHCVEVDVEQLPLYRFDRMAWLDLG